MFLAAKKIRTRFCYISFLSREKLPDLPMTKHSMCSDIAGQPSSEEGRWALHIIIDNNVMTWTWSLLFVNGKDIWLRNIACKRQLTQYVPLTCQKLFSSVVNYYKITGETPDSKFISREKVCLISKIADSYVYERWMGTMIGNCGVKQCVCISTPKGKQYFYHVSVSWTTRSITAC